VHHLRVGRERGELAGDPVVEPGTERDDQVWVTDWTAVWVQDWTVVGTAMWGPDWTVVSDAGWVAV
jgi:hypothetical protein